MISSTRLYVGLSRVGDPSGVLVLVHAARGRLRVLFNATRRATRSRPTWSRVIWLTPNRDSRGRANAARRRRRRAAGDLAGYNSRGHALGGAIEVARMCPRFTLRASSTPPEASRLGGAI